MNLEIEMSTESCKHNTVPNKQKQIVKTRFSPPNLTYTQMKKQNFVHFKMKNNLIQLEFEHSDLWFQKERGKSLF